MSTNLDQSITSVKDRNADVKLVAFEAKFLFESVQTSIRDGVLVEFVHKVHAEDDGHDKGVESLDERFLFKRVDGASSKVVGWPIFFNRFGFLELIVLGTVLG